MAFDHRQQDPSPELGAGVIAASEHDPHQVAELVLDPFAGTGSALVSAVRLGRRPLGCELKEEFARFGEQRVRGAGGAEEIAR
jgi:hypothetical protein